MLDDTYTVDSYCQRASLLLDDILIGTNDKGRCIADTLSAGMPLVGMEGFKDKLNGVWEAIKRFLAKIRDYINRLFTWMFGGKPSGKHGEKGGNYEKAKTPVSGAIGKEVSKGDKAAAAAKKGAKAASVNAKSTKVDKATVDEVVAKKKAGEPVATPNGEAQKPVDPKTDNGTPPPPKALDKEPLIDNSDILKANKNARDLRDAKIKAARDKTATNKRSPNEQAKVDNEVEKAKPVEWIEINDALRSSESAKITMVRDHLFIKDGGKSLDYDSMLAAVTYRLNKRSYGVLHEVMEDITADMNVAKIALIKGEDKAVLDIHEEDLRKKLLSVRLVLSTQIPTAIHAVKVDDSTSSDPVYVTKAITAHSKIQYMYKGGGMHVKTITSGEAVEFTHVAVLDKAYFSWRKTKYDPALAKYQKDIKEVHALIDTSMSGASKMFSKPLSGYDNVSGSLQTVLNTVRGMLYSIYTALLTYTKAHMELITRLEKSITAYNQLGSTLISAMT